MKKLFRFHKGGLEESMATCVEVGNREELVKIIAEKIEMEMQPCDILVKPYGVDHRIGWNTYIVTLGARGGVLGFTNFDPEEG